MYRLISLVLIALPSLSWAGGGWPQPPGTAYVKVAQYAIVADNYYTPSGDIVPITTTGYYATSLYAEVGIIPNLTGTLYFPFFVRSTLNRIERPDGELVQAGDFINGIGDTDLGFKYTYYQKQGYAFSAGLLLGIPLGNSSGGRTQLLQTGDGEFNQMIRLDFSKSFGNGNFYMSAYGGFNNRTNNFSDEVRFGLEAGYRLGSVWLIVRSESIQSLMNGSDDFVPTNGIFANNLEYVSLSPEVNWNINDQWGVSLNAGFALSGRRILADPAFGAGVYWRIGG